MSSANDAHRIIKLISDNDAINADSTFKLISNWSLYPDFKEPGKDYLYYYTDPVYDRIPLRVYVPLSYKRTQKTPCILLLHGAVGGSHFADIDSLAKFDDDILFTTLNKKNYIIIRPVAEAAKKFDWVNNDFSGRNLTFKTLTNALSYIKKVLNIDDNKIFAFGHSDGSDGAVGFGVYSPDVFAGVIAYNSMLNNLFARDFFIRNIQNRPLYIVHSDKDDLRPIQITRIIIDSLSKFDKGILYKEYIGYKHYDKHLDKDLPYACEFMKSINRNPFHSTLYWETDNGELYNTVDWLKVNAVNTEAPAADWHKPLNVKVYSETVKQWLDYYSGLHKSVVVRATFNNNVFNMQTSGIKEIELLISPVMINLEEPVVININGKQVFASKVKADKKFMLDNFENSFDRDAIWVTSIKLKVE